jgi:hypothetical protein
MKEEVIVDPVSNLVVGLIPTETTEVDVDPLITTKLAYVDNLKKELEGIQEQMASLQYQMDIRVTALTLYQSSLEVVVEEEPKENGKDKEDESNS